MLIIGIVILLIDWNTLRALYTLLYSNDISIVKEIKIGQSAAKRPYRMKVQRLSLRGVLGKTGKSKIIIKINLFLLIIIFIFVEIKNLHI